MQQKIYSVDEAVKFFNEAKPKFVSLKNAQGKIEIAYNIPSKKSTERFKQIEALLKGKGLPDGIYLICYRESIQPTASEYNIAVGKGNYKPFLNEATPVQVQQPVNAVYQAQEVWSMPQALTEIEKRLQAENNNKFLQMENERLKEALAEQHLNPPAENNFAETMKGLFESFSPVIDKYFDLQEKRLKLDAAKINYSRLKQLQGKASVNDGLSGKAAVNDSLRDDGGVKFDSPDYERYFAAMEEQADDATFEYELQLLEANNPDLYKALCNKYQIDIQDNGEGLN